MLILVTNDDGIASEGLIKLQEALSSVGEVLVIAPDRDWTGAGHSKSIHKTLRVFKVEMGDGRLAYATDGTPTDCVALGVLGLVGRRPDVVVSGINKGPNLGHDVTYSGTVAAAMEAAISGIPALALSLGGHDSWNFDFAAAFAARLLNVALARPIQPGIFFNVNVPALPEESIKGIEITRLGQRIYRDVLMCFKDPDGGLCYRIGGEAPVGLEEDGTDIKALADGKISVTPIHLDLTHHGILSDLQNSGLQEAFKKALLGGG
ncbi:MAG: 5'/3'-nucleotidase SurE [Dehalococcoidia bacterium]|nr:5'/3'-nucleotidase SurE [Dehalococcoidia bacterium]